MFKSLQIISKKKQESDSYLNIFSIFSSNNFLATNEAGKGLREVLQRPDPNCPVWL